MYMYIHVDTYMHNTCTGISLISCYVRVFPWLFGAIIKKQNKLVYKRKDVGTYKSTGAVYTCTCTVSTMCITVYVIAEGGMFNSRTAASGCWADIRESSCTAQQV